MSDSTLTVHDDGTMLAVITGDVAIAHYVYRPEAPGSEAPKPYLHPIRSLSGAPMSISRPWDHRWHKGLQMTWSHLSGQNFWGGPSFSAEEGYRWIDNLGRIDHASFIRVSDGDDQVLIEEELNWITAAGEHWITEHRAQIFHTIDADRGLWALDFATTLRNVRGRALNFGSPTTHGREAAGYTGLFWRGPRAWTHGTVMGADGRAGDDLMGAEAAWIAYSGEHDEIDGGGTVLAIAGRSSAAVPIKWFVRRDPFATINPSPSFDQEFTLADSEVLELEHRHLFIDHMCGQAELDDLGSEFAL